MSRWGIAIGILLCLACVQGGSAFNAKAHFGITSQAADDEGILFDSVQNEYLVINQEMVDVISLSNDDDDVDTYFVPDLLSNSEEIEALFADSAHFQYYKNPTEIDQEWGRLINQTHKEIKAAEVSGDHRKFLTVLGMSLHTVEDFYGHTNWADLQDAGYFESKGYEGDVTWFDVKSDDKNAMSGIDEFLTEGSVKIPLNSLDHDTLHKDWPSRPHYDTAYREAYYGTRQWIQLVKSWVSEDFWNQAMDPNIDTSTWGHISETPNLPHYKSVDFEDCDNFLMHFLWYAGAWTSDYSKSTYVLSEWPSIFGQLYWYATDFGFIENDFHINHDDGYRAFFDKVEIYGYDSLYKQGLYTPSDGIHIDTMDKIPQVRWFRIATESVDETDRYGLDIDPASQCEFYNKVDIDGHRFYEAPPEDGDDYVHADEGEFVQEWVVLYPFPMDQETVDVKYALWEEDFGAARYDDDHCDIEYAWDEKDWIRTLYTGEEKTTVVTDGKRDIKWQIDHGDGDEARVQLTYEFVPLGTGSAAALGLEVDSSPDAIHSGDEVTYTYTVKNEGDRVLSNVAITDDSGLVPVYQSGDTNQNGQLDLTETWTYTAKRTVTSDDHVVTSSVTVTATDATGTVSTVRKTSTSLVYVLHPAIQVEKTVSSESVDRGQQVTYTYTVSNTGDTRLLISDKKIVDDKVTPTYISGDTNDDGYLDVADPGDPQDGVPATAAEVWTYTALSSPTHTTTNTVTASGTDDLGKTVSSSDSATVVVTVIVEVDVKPGGCPNGLGLKDKGVIPVAIVGGLPDYTINEIAMGSLKLNGIPAIKVNLEDTATPYLGTDTCGCHALKGDGTMDIIFKVDTPEVVGSLGKPAKNSYPQLTVTGTLNDGITLLKGSDCVKIS